MKPFDLEAAKRGKPIVTRDGRPVKFIAHVPEAKSEIIVCMIGGEVLLFQDSGAFVSTCVPEHLDLFMAPPPMRSINGHEYPEPVREPLGVGQKYFLADPEYKIRVIKYYWTDSDVDLLWLKRGLIHLTREAAEAHSRAIILASGCEE